MSCFLKSFSPCEKDDLLGGTPRKYIHDIHAYFLCWLYQSLRMFHLNHQVLSVGLVNDEFVGDRS